MKQGSTVAAAAGKALQVVDSLRARVIPTLVVVALVMFAGFATFAAPSAAAKMPAYDHTFRVYIAYGDIPALYTAAPEPEGVWNMAQLLRIQHAAGHDESHQLAVPAGHTVLAHQCTCAGNVTEASGMVSFAVPAAAEQGEHTLLLVTQAPAGEALAVTVPAPTGIAGRDQVVVFFAPLGAEVEAPLRADASLPTTDGDRTIWAFPGSNDEPAAAWYAVHPRSAGAGEKGGFDWLAAGVGVFAGIVLWGILVQKGWVQKRGRKQVAATAAHVEAAKEPKPVLEARKRALLAALKEVELARQANEIDVPTYDVVKADLKKQAVTVMRAIEETP